MVSIQLWCSTVLSGGAKSSAPLGGPQRPRVAGSGAVSVGARRPDESRRVQAGRRWRHLPAAVRTRRGLRAETGEKKFVFYLYAFSRGATEL